MSAVQTRFSVVSPPGAPDCVVLAEGEIDAFTSRRLAETLRAAQADWPTKIMVDMAAVSFIDLTGLDVLFAAHERGRDNGTELVLRGPTAPILRLLKRTGLCDSLPVVNGPTGVA